MKSIFKQLKSIFFYNMQELIKITLSPICFLLTAHIAFAQVIVTSAGNVDMCVGGAYKTIPDFKVAEKVNTDFTASTSLQTYELNAPSNFEFNPGIGSITTPSSTDISFAYLNVTATKITLNYFLNATAKKDSFIFKNIQVRAVGTNSSNQLRFSSGSASQNQNNTGQYVHANFNSAGTNVSLNLSNSNVCINAGNVTLNGESPGGGSFTGTGVTGNTFNPTVAGVGTFVISYSQTTNGCTGTATGSITVKPAPSVTFFGLNNSYCSNENAVALTGFPTGGTFAGPGISGSTFSPQSVSNPPATINITYTYKDLTTNCSSTTNQNGISIKSAPTNVTITLSPEKQNYSSIEDSVLIDGSYSPFSTPSGLPSGGSITVSGNGVVTGSDGKSRFFPNIVGQGSSTIVRRLTTSNGCYAENFKNVSVALASSNSIGGLGSIYCSASSNVSLSVNNGNGKFTCTTPVNVNILGTVSTIQLDVTSTMILDNNINDGQAFFMPSKAPYLNQTYTIYFTDNSDPTKSGYTSTIIQGNTLPSIVYSGSDSSKVNILCGKYCNGDGEVNLSATPVGGTFSGVAVSGNKFKPSLITNDSTVLYVYYQYTSGQGCGGKDSVKVFIKKSPDNLSITGPASNGINEFCGNDTLSRQCDGFPAGGYYKGIGIIDTLAGKFKASNAVESNDQKTNVYPITYFYTSPNKCSSSIQRLVTVNRSPIVTFSGMNNVTDKTKAAQYCKSNSSIQLTANLFPGTFTLIKSAGDTIPNGLNGGLLVPKDRDPDTYRINYSYTDTQTKCSSSEAQTVVIHKLPEISIIGLKDQYCKSDADVSLTLNNPGNGAGTLSSLTGGLIGSSVFSPALSPVNKHILKYTYTDIFGCASNISDSTIVYGKPEPSFTLSSVCEGDLIHFKDSASVVPSADSAMSSISKILWRIDNTYHEKNNIDTILKSGNHTIIYTLTSTANCTASATKSIYIGPYPTISFSWDKVCNADDTEFKNGTSIPASNDSWIDTVRWVFGDGKFKNYKAANTNPSISSWNVNHKYPTYGVYNVTQTAITNLNCISIDSQKVYILPAEKATPTEPYSNDFEVDEGGWVSSGIYDAISTWKWGIADKSVINTVSTNDHIWVTGLKGTNKPDEISYVYSPCFNLSALTKPMIRMNIWRGMDTVVNYSGAVLQYSVDGLVWRKVGDNKGEGIKWYNNTGNINSKPNGILELNQDGWTGMDSSGWENVRHELDTVFTATNTKNLRFRIAFAASNIPYNGFAFDDVWIGERTKFVLAEHFTNNASVSTENNYIYSLSKTYSADIAVLEYHTGFPGYDQLNSRNTADPSARALYYGISQVPGSALDGSYFITNNPLRITESKLKTRVLEDPEFRITINPETFNPSVQKVSGTVNVESLMPVPNNVTLQIAVIERYLNTNQWVLSKLLPNAAGKSYPDNWSVNHIETQPFNWTFTSNTINNPDKIGIVAFIQDNVTKEIYQAAYQGIGASVETSVFEPNETTSTVSLYPNPANDITTVVLNGKLKGNYNWIIFDELGRVADQGSLQDGTEGFTINTQNYSSGFYTLRLSNSSDGVKTQKFVVMH